jgi:hypothetical protein
MVFVTSPQCPGITRRLRVVAEDFPGQVAMTVSSDPNERGEVIAAANGLVLVDGHYTGPGYIDGLGLGLSKACPGITARVVIVGCCYSGKRDFTDAVRPGLDRQVAYLGYSGMAPHDHAEIVFPPVLRALLDAGFPGSVDTATSIINDSLAQLSAERPRKKSLALWHARVLEP